MQAVEPAAHTFHEVIVLVHTVRAVVGKHPHFLRERVVVGDDRTGVAVRAEVFSGVKAERPRDAEGAHKPSAKRGEMRLRAVFHDREPVLARGLHDGVHLRRLAEQMHGQDRFRPRGDRRRDLRRVEVVAVVLHVHKDGPRAGERDRFRRRDPTVARRDDLVARADAEHFQRDENRVRAVAAAHAMLHAVLFRVGFFKVRDEFSADESGALDDRGDGGVDVGFVRAILRFQVNKRDVHGV